MLLGNGFWQWTFLSPSVLMSLQIDDHLIPTPHSDHWLQLLLPSAASSQTELNWLTTANLQFQVSILGWLPSQSQSHIATDSQSVIKSWCPHLGLMTRYLLPFDSYSLLFVGHPLWREDGSVFCICCWPLPAQSFSGLSPLGLAIICYCLRFETSLFVVSYDSEGHRIYKKYDK
jgi:hypothetical protein